MGLVAGVAGIVGRVGEVRHTSFNTKAPDLLRQTSNNKLLLKKQTGKDRRKTRFNISIKKLATVPRSQTRCYGHRDTELIIDGKGIASLRARLL